MDRKVWEQLIKLDYSDFVDRTLIYHLILQLTEPFPFLIAFYGGDRDTWLNLLRVLYEGAGETCDEVCSLE